jgi:hypothetical protein
VPDKTGKQPVATGQPRESRVSDEAVLAAVRRRHPLFSNYTLAAKQDVAREAREDLELARPSIEADLKERLLSEPFLRGLDSVLGLIYMQTDDAPCLDDYRRAVEAALEEVTP